MADLYSIAGFLNDSYKYGVSFGGFFFFGKGIGNSPFEDNINGMLVDFYRSSFIDGNMRPETSLIFTKKYDSRGEELIKYELRFDSSSGLWLGEFNGLETGKGRVACKTSLSIEDVILPKGNSFCPEEEMEELLHSMVEKGLLVEVSDESQDNEKRKL